MIQTLVEEKINDYKEKRKNKPQEYEDLLIKLEKEIREHIQTEQQLKLYAESFQSIIEEIEKENLILKNKLNNEFYYDNNYNIEEKINDLKNEIKNKDKILNSYEAQNLKLSESERKLKKKLINEQKIFNEKELKYKNEIDSLKQKILDYEKKLNFPIGDNHHNHLYNQYSTYLKKCISSKEELKINSLNSIQKYNKNKIHQNGPALSASSSMEKIERYLMNKFAKTQLQFKSKINKINSSSKNSNKKVSSPYNNSMIEKGLNNEFFYNNKLQMNDSSLSNLSIKQRKKYNRQKSAENNSIIRNKKKEEDILKNILMSNNIIFNINLKKDSKKKTKGYNNSKYKRVPYTCNLKDKIKNTGENNNNGTYNNINFNKKIINNNINIYANTFRQDNHNIYIKGNNEKSFHNSLRGNSGNSSARDFHTKRYNSNEFLIFRKNSLGKKNKI